MAKNHYVSQLIIKRFSPAVTTFDTVKQCLIENRKAHKIFYKEDIYDNDIEKKLAHDLEQPFARLLDEKILHSNKIVLFRNELFLLKQFLLLDSVRTYESEGFVRVLMNFKENVERYLKIPSDPFAEQVKSMPSVFDLNLEPRAIQMRAMRLYLECKCVGDLLKHPLITKEFYCWARVNYDAYVAFWDSDESQEFILTSTGMVSEYEPSHSIFEGLDLSKHSFLHSRIKTDKINVHLAKYAHLLSFNQIMYENFNIFNLSSTRCMVLIHPFFKLYNDFQGVVNEEKINIEKPDIWPSCFENKDICLPPENDYKMSCYIFSPNDQYIYTPKKLTVWDTIYLNSLILGQTHDILGFGDITKVIDSIVFVNVLNSISDNELLRKLRGLDALERWVDNMLKDKYFYIFNYYKELKLKCSIKIFDYIDKFAYLMWKDVRENRYVLEYLLSNENMVHSMDNFKFMGSPETRVKAIKEMLKKVTKSNLL